MWNLPVASLSDAIGLIGVLTYLGSYFALQAGFVRGQTYTYATMNIIAASCVLYDLQHDFNLPSALIQISWITISLVGIARLSFISVYHRFNEEEEAFISSKLPDLPKNLARRLLRSGFWADVEPGTMLTTEGRPVHELIYLARGEAVVSFGDHLLIRMDGDKYIGEVTCLSAEPATATVTVTKPSRCFCIGTTELRRLTERNSELRQALESSFAGDVRHKLLMTNERQKDLAADLPSRVMVN